MGNFRPTSWWVLARADPRARPLGSGTRPAPATTMGQSLLYRRNNYEWRDDHPFLPLNPQEPTLAFSDAMMLPESRRLELRSPQLPSTFCRWIRNAPAVTSAVPAQISGDGVSPSRAHASRMDATGPISESTAICEGR
jgi:hypothetical protein